MPRIHLSENEKTWAIAKLEDGWSLRAVAAVLNVSKSAIGLIKKRWDERHTVQRAPGSGGQRISNEEQNYALVNFLREHPFESAVRAKDVTQFPGSIWSARRRIKENGLKCSAAAKKPALSQINKERRLHFANEYIHRNQDFWNSVIFTDEKNFQSCYKGKIRVYRPPNCRFEENFVQQDRTSGRFSVNVWGWISADGLGICHKIDERLTGNVYRDILENIMLPSVTERFQENNFVFQHDNCPAHTARVVREWFNGQNFEVLPWPAKSPDLNPIENIWGYIVKKLYSNDFRPDSRDALWEAIQGGWQDAVENYDSRNLINSMRNRLQSVIVHNGSSTKY